MRRRPLHLPPPLSRLVPRTVRSRLTLVSFAVLLAAGAVVLAVAGFLWGAATRSNYQVPIDAPLAILNLKQVPTGATSGTSGNTVFAPLATNRTIRVRRNPAGTNSGSLTTNLGVAGSGGVSLRANSGSVSGGAGQVVHISGNASSSLAHLSALAGRGGTTVTFTGAAPELALTPSAIANFNKVVRQLALVASAQHSFDLSQLFLYSGIALAIVALMSIAFSWLMAGRALGPLRTITASTREISASNLHERLDLEGPDDELKELGDTIDGLLERLERAFESQRLFVANASHELRTPLATMRASLDVALGKPGPLPDTTVALAARLNAELDQIDRLLESLLALARAERGPAHEEVPLSLGLLTTAALQERAGAIADLGLDVRSHTAADAWVEGNETLLSRMVSNVVDNAVRHNEPGGFIDLRSDVEGDIARLTVENGGAVLDDAGVQELFRPFRRLGAERTGSDGGLGLGLSIVAAIAETHGGHVELRPREGGGLCVVISLPLAHEAGNP